VYLLRSKSLLLDQRNFYHLLQFRKTTSLRCPTLDLRKVLRARLKSRTVNVSF